MKNSFQDALFFGRGGNGAPMRTNSGRLRSTVYANPEIRYPFKLNL